MPDDKSISPSSAAKFFEDFGLTVSHCHAKCFTKSHQDLLVPELSAFDGFSECEEIFEWIGAVACDTGMCRSLDTFVYNVHT